MSRDIRFVYRPMPGPMIVIDQKLVTHWKINLVINKSKWLKTIMGLFKKSKINSEIDELRVYVNDLQQKYWNLHHKIEDLERSNQIIEAVLPNIPYKLLCHDSNNYSQNRLEIEKEGYILSGMIKKDGYEIWTKRSL